MTPTDPPGSPGPPKPPPVLNRFKPRLRDDEEFAGDFKLESPPSKIGERVSIRRCGSQAARAPTIA